jgi:hypothetical protein
VFCEKRGEERERFVGVALLDGWFGVRAHRVERNKRKYVLVPVSTQQGEADAKAIKPTIRLACLALPPSRARAVCKHKTGREGSINGMSGSKHTFH